MSSQYFTFFKAGILCFALQLPYVVKVDSKPNPQVQGIQIPLHSSDLIINSGSNGGSTQESPQFSRIIVKTYQNPTKIKLTSHNRFSLELPKRYQNPLLQSQPEIFQSVSPNTEQQLVLTNVITQLVERSEPQKIEPAAPAPESPKSFPFPVQHPNQQETQSANDKSTKGKLGGIELDGNIIPATLVSEFEEVTRLPSRLRLLGYDRARTLDMQKVQQFLKTLVPEFDGQQRQPQGLTIGPPRSPDSEVHTSHPTPNFNYPEIQSPITPQNFGHLNYQLPGIPLVHIFNPARPFSKFSDDFVSHTTEHVRMPQNIVSFGPPILNFHQQSQLNFFNPTPITSQPSENLVPHIQQGGRQPEPPVQNFNQQLQPNVFGQTSTTSQHSGNPAPQIHQGQDFNMAQQVVAPETNPLQNVPQTQQQPSFQNVRNNEYRIQHHFLQQPPNQLTVPEREHVKIGQNPTPTPTKLDRASTDFRIVPSLQPPKIEIEMPQPQVEKPQSQNEPNAQSISESQPQSKSKSQSLRQPQLQPHLLSRPQPQPQSELQSQSPSLAPFDDIVLREISKSDKGILKKHKAETAVDTKAKTSGPEHSNAPAQAVRYPEPTINPITQSTTEPATTSEDLVHTDEIDGVVHKVFIIPQENVHTQVTSVSKPPSHTLEAVASNSEDSEFGQRVQSQSTTPESVPNTFGNLAYTHGISSHKVTITPPGRDIHLKIIPTLVTTSLKTDDESEDDFEATTQLSAGKFVHAHKVGNLTHQVAIITPNSIHFTTKGVPIPDSNIPAGAMANPNNEKVDFGVTANRSTNSNSYVNGETSLNPHKSTAYQPNDKYDFNEPSPTSPIISPDIKFTVGIPGVNGNFVNPPRNVHIKQENNFLTPPLTENTQTTPTNDRKDFNNPSPKPPVLNPDIKFTVAVPGVNANFINKPRNIHIKQETQKVLLLPHAAPSENMQANVEVKSIPNEIQDFAVIDKSNLNSGPTTPNPNPVIKFTGSNGNSIQTQEHDDSGGNNAIDHKHKITIIPPEDYQTTEKSVPVSTTTILTNNGNGGADDVADGDGDFGKRIRISANEKSSSTFPANTIIPITTESGGLFYKHGYTEDHVHEIKISPPDNVHTTIKSIPVRTFSPMVEITDFQKFKTSSPTFASIRLKPIVKTIHPQTMIPSSVSSTTGSDGGVDFIYTHGSGEIDHQHKVTIIPPSDVHTTIKSVPIANSLKNPDNQKANKQISDQTPVLYSSTGKSLASSKPAVGNRAKSSPAVETKNYPEKITLTGQNQIESATILVLPSSNTNISNTKTPLTSQIRIGFRRFIAGLQSLLPKSNSPPTQETVSNKVIRTAYDEIAEVDSLLLPKHISEMRPGFIKEEDSGPFTRTTNVPTLIITDTYTNPLDIMTATTPEIDFGLTTGSESADQSPARFDLQETSTVPMEISTTKIPPELLMSTNSVDVSSSTTTVPQKSQTRIIPVDLFVKPETNYVITPKPMEKTRFVSQILTIFKNNIETSPSPTQNLTTTTTTTTTTPVQEPHDFGTTNSMDISSLGTTVVPQFTGTETFTESSQAEVPETTEITSVIPEEIAVFVDKFRTAGATETPIIPTPRTILQIESEIPKVNVSDVTTQIPASTLVSETEPSVNEILGILPIT